MILVATLCSILVVGYISWSKAREMLTEHMFSHLISIRSSKAHQIESYFNTLKNQIETLVENRMVVAAMTELDREFYQLKPQSISPEWDRAIEKFYNQEFLPRLARNMEGKPVFATYRPASLASRYLQYNYIASNSNSIERKDELEDAKDNSNYSKIHNKYHSLFRNLIKRFNYSDLFLINAEKGEIVYSVSKEIDFSSNLYSGSLSNTSLAQLVKQVRDNPDRGIVQLVDFQFYRPSHNTPVAFISAPIFDGNRRIGILAVKLPITEINSLLSGARNWKQDGLGETGETYLVGNDIRLRSTPRLLIENPKSYSKVLRQNRVRSETIRLIENLNTSLLLHPIETIAAREAIQGKSGTQIIQGYWGSKVYSSYAPLNIHGVNWGIVSEMALSEAYVPINSLQNYLLLSTIILIVLITLFSTIAIERLILPIDLIVKRSLLTSKRDFKDSAPANIGFQQDRKAKDELSELVQIFKNMEAQVQQKTEIIAQKEQENEALLINLLPRPMIERWRQGETRIIDRVEQVTVVAVQILGLKESAEQHSNQTIADALNELITMLDDHGEKSGLERWNCFDDRYVAGCGLTKPRLDHTKRGVEFAKNAFNIAKEIQQKYHLNLRLRIGIHTGSVNAALIWKQKLRYDLWGEPISIANQLCQKAEANSIQVTQAVFDRLQDIFPFGSDKSIVLSDNRTIKTWVLGISGMLELINELKSSVNFDDDENPNTKEPRL